MISWRITGHLIVDECITSSDTVLNWSRAGEGEVRHRDLSPP